MPDATSRSSQLDRVLADLLAQASEIEAAAVVSFDGLPMASALPVTMDEDRVAAMSAALLSLGERAAEGLGRGGLNQVYIEGDNGTVFLVSADDEGVLVAVAAKGAKVGMMLYEVRRAAEAVAAVLRVDEAPAEAAVPAQPVAAPAAHAEPQYAEPQYAEPQYAEPQYAEPQYAEPVLAQPPVSQPEPVATYAPATSDSSWPSYLPSATAANGNGSAEPPSWS
jgi:predicted regulator of Ras-like GTPase activity (Roadblock/LC7/MglB family)